jgi:hypothetical protein
MLDRRWTGDRLGDELELAYIGIPASTAEDDSLDQQVG